MISLSQLEKTHNKFKDQRYGHVDREHLETFCKNSIEMISFYEKQVNFITVQNGNLAYENEQLKARLAQIEASKDGIADQESTITLILGIINKIVYSEKFIDKSLQLRLSELVEKIKKTV